MKGTSKFDYDIFISSYDDRGIVAVNKQKYSLAEATKIAENELIGFDGSYAEKAIRVADGYVRYQIYYTDDNEKNIGWCYWESQYLTAKNKERCCPVYVFEIKENVQCYKKTI